MPHHDVKDMDERMASEKNRQTDVEGIRPIDIPRRPRKRYTRNEKCNSKIANEVAIEGPAVWHLRGKICVPGLREEGHPSPIQEVQQTE